MSENPGPSSPATHGDEQQTSPVETGPGPDAGDVNQGGTTTDDDDLDEG